MPIMLRFRKLESPAVAEAHLQLSLDTREVGRVTIVRCNGRIVAGQESESLREHFTWLLRDRRSIVLHLGDVGFIDSSGLGTIVRAFSSTRQAHGELKLCNVPPFVHKVLEMSRLNSVLESHESEEEAIAAFYHPSARSEAPAAKGPSILCLDSNVDVLAYLRELLRGAGYEVQTSSRIGDALMLMRVSHFDLLLVGPDMTPTADRPPAFLQSCAKVASLELGKEFSTRHAGEAGADLLEIVGARLKRS